MAGKDDPDVLAFAVNEDSKLNGPKTALKPRAIRSSIGLNPENGRSELSTFCADGLGEEELWRLLDASVPVKSDIGHPARVDFDVAFLRFIGLDLDPNWEPERHVDVLRWPDADAELTTTIQLIVQKYKPILRPTVAPAPQE